MTGGVIIMKKSTTVRAIVVVSSMLLAACSTGTGTGTSPGAAAPTSIDRIRLPGIDRGYPTPFAYLKGPGLVHVNFVFDTLIWKDSTGSYLPWLAESWERSPDGTEYRFVLREGVLWQDGRPLTADDVVFTFDYITKGAGTNQTQFIGKPNVKEVVAESPSVVVIRLPGPSALFEPTVAGRVPIIPRHIWESVSDPAKYLEPEAVIGSGPYKLESYDRTTASYLYVANEAYFLGVPYVKRLEFVPAPNEILSLQRGDVDMATAGIENLEEPIPDSAYSALENDSKLAMIVAPGEANRSLHFNLARGFPYDDKRFRQAVAYAIDRTDLVTRILFGRGEPGSAGNLAPSHPYLAPDLPTYAKDLAKARALLDEIGLRDTNGDGVRELPDGSVFKPELQANSLFSANTPELMKEYLRAVGIDIEIRILDQASSDANGAQGRYDMALFTCGGMGGDPDFLRTRLSARTPATMYSKIHGFDNARFEELAAKQAATLDEADRKPLVQEMQRIVADELPLLSLYVPSRILLYGKGAGFDAWYFTPGALFGLHPGPLNKQAFVVGKKVGMVQ
jgi:peptide/nickel transport system substrate-binding protein